MISTAIRTATPRSWGSHRGCRAVADGCGRAEAVKRYTRRRAKAEEAAAAAEVEAAATASSAAAVYTPPRVCSDCRTSETPLWRSGPDGPKSLCNACGIKYRKRRRGLAPPHGKIAAPPTSGSCAVSKSQVGEVLSAEELKRKQREKQERTLKLLLLQHQRQRSNSRREEKAAAEAGKEVEEAALLLLSLSSGLFAHS